VVLTGSGEKAFVAGADIAEFASFSPEEGEALATRGLTTPGLVIGQWPVEPSLAEKTNVVDLQDLGAPLVGAIPAQAGLSGEFAHIAATSLHPRLGGTFDEADFTHTHTQELNR
jgi:hypothetical protein